MKDNQELLDKFESEYKDGDKVDYRSFLEDLREFNYDSGVPDKGTAMQTYKTISSSTIEPEYNSHIGEDKYVVLDTRVVPQNALDNIEK